MANPGVPDNVKLSTHAHLELTNIQHEGTSLNAKVELLDVTVQKGTNEPMKLDRNLICIKNVTDAEGKPITITDEVKKAIEQAVTNIHDIGEIEDKNEHPTTNLDEILSITKSRATEKTGEIRKETIKNPQTRENEELSVEHEEKEINVDGKDYIFKYVVAKRADEYFIHRILAQDPITLQYFRVKPELRKALKESVDLDSYNF